MLKKPDWTKDFSRNLVHDAPFIELPRTDGRAVELFAGVYYEREATREVRCYRHVHLFLEMGMGGYRLPIIHLVDTVNVQVRIAERGPYPIHTYWFGSYAEAARQDLLGVFPKKNTREVSPYQKMVTLADSICKIAGTEPLSGQAWLPACNKVVPDDLIIIVTSGDIILDIRWKGIYSKIKRRFFWFFPDGDDLKFSNGRRIEPEFLDISSEGI